MGGQEIQPRLPDPWSFIWFLVVLLIGSTIFLVHLYWGTMWALRSSWATARRVVREVSLHLGTVRMKFNKENKEDHGTETSGLPVRTRQPPTSSRDHLERGERRNSGTPQQTNRETLLLRSHLGGCQAPMGTP